MAEVLVHREDEKPDLYELIVTAAGPHYFDRVHLTDEDLLGLEPTFVDRDGYVFERYGEDDDYVELRRDLVVARSLRKVEKTIASGADVEAADRTHEPDDRRPTP